MSIGAAIRATRGSRSQDDLAASVGIDQTMISRYERDIGDITVSLVAAIESACDRPRGYIFRLAGFAPAGDGVLDAIANDPALNDDQREMLSAAYETAVARRRARNLKR